MNEWCQVVNGEWPRLLRAANEHHAMYFSNAVLHSLGMACDYFRRLHSQTDAWPLLLAHFVFSPPGKHCKLRQDVATRMLGLGTMEDLATIDCTTLKILHLFRNEIKQSCNDGLLDEHVWGLLHSIFNLWSLETQEIEGINSTIKHIMKIAPFTGWELLSTRTMV
eukprot:5786935-Pyramimonas_sp.AAC.1